MSSSYCLLVVDPLVGDLSLPIGDCDWYLLSYERAPARLGPLPMERSANDFLSRTADFVLCSCLRESKVFNYSVIRLNDGY